MQLVHRQLRRDYAWAIDIQPCVFLQEGWTGVPGADGLGTIAQGFLEDSNVSVVEEMVNMILGQRAYEANSRVIRAADEMLQQVNNLS